MRFYPLGSSSLNQVYNNSLAVTASISSYSATASYGARVVTASHALQGVRGPDGSTGVCSYPLGPQGDVGLPGFGGPSGGVSIAVAKP
jgi:hypothetical protein